MANPSHHDLAGYLRCVVFDLNVLATSTERMILEAEERIIESHKTAALVKLRAIFDFLHRPKAKDTIKVKMFRAYSPIVPKLRTDNWDQCLTHQSINTYVVHLDIERAAKTVPQPKFERGEKAVLRTAVALMNDAKEFVDSVIQHQDFVGLNRFGNRWRAEFGDTLKRLNTIVTAL